MVNGRTLEDELSRISNFFASLDSEQFEKIVLECGAGEILPSDKSLFAKTFSKRYANLETAKKSQHGSAFDLTFSETEAA